jgi:tRNA A-37 threonylcarbamoyl transferase component Bud32
MQISPDTDPAELLETATLIQEATSIGNADVYTVDIGGRKVLLKTYRDRPRFIRLLFGRRALKNEFNILRRLDAVDGVPKAIAILRKDTMLSEFVNNAQPMVASRALEPHEYPPESFFTKLKKMVEALHEQGISHGDIRRMNVLRGDDDQPYLIDFATAVSTQGRAPWLRQALFRMFRKADDFATAKLTYTYYPNLLSQRERKRLEHPPWYLRVGRFLRKRVYRKLIKQRRWEKRLSKAKAAIRSLGNDHSEEISR